MKNSKTIHNIKRQGEFFREEGTYLAKIAIRHSCDEYHKSIKLKKNLLMPSIENHFIKKGQVGVRFAHRGLRTDF